MGLLSVLTLVLSIVMIALSIRFNNSGLTTDLGKMSDYSNFAFVALLIASIIAFMAACCGMLTCKCTNRCIAVVFGCTLLPAALVIVTFGFILTGVSHTSEADLQEFCVKDYDAFKETEGKDNFLAQARETVEQVDYTVGSVVSKLMCSNLCPCNISDLPREPVDVRLAWL